MDVLDSFVKRWRACRSARRSPEKNVSRDLSGDRAAREAFNDARSAKLRYEYSHPSGSML